jgi:hypothetical protein
MGRKGSCGFAQASAAARYVSKYVGKAFEIAEFGRHRYERAQGFPITSYRVRRYDMADGREYAEHVFRCAPSFVWSSTDEEDWSGPPCFVLFFMGRVNAGRKLTPFHRRAQGIRATARRANDCELTRPGGSLGTAPDVAAT